MTDGHRGATGWTRHDHGQRHDGHRSPKDVPQVVIASYPGDGRRNCRSSSASNIVWQDELMMYGRNTSSS